MQELKLSAATAGATHGTGQPLFQHMLDIVDYGMLLLRPNGRVAFANRAARIELDDHPILRLEESKLCIRHARDAASLHGALADAIHKGCQRLLTLGEEGSQMLSVSIIPLQQPGDTSPRGAMLLLGKRKVCDALSVAAYARLRSLTMAEERVLELLCAGSRPGEIADALGVALSTVRTQIASILAKAGTTRIGALQQELSRLPPLRSLLSTA